MESPVRLVAQYFPQLHRIAENDAWWGEGFTDWTNVRRARPLFDGHYQPRVPQGGDYYDQASERVVRRQAELARAYGIAAFNHYHYWFDGKQLLSAPTDLLLAHKDIDIQFCLCWANETWSRRWDGLDHHILIAQTHPPTVESWGRHFECLIKYWIDDRALRIDGKPVFFIYRPLKVQQAEWMFDYWQTRARRDYGLDGIYFATVVQWQFPPWEVLRHYDAVMLFQPFAAMANLPAPPPPHKPAWRRLAARMVAPLPAAVREHLYAAGRARSVPTVIDYDQVWEQILARRPDGHLPVFPGAYVDWDNTARYGDRATVFRGATPEKFEQYLERLLRKTAAQPRAERLVFINAWNEWAESAYLEPDERYGLRYLEAVRTALERGQPAPRRDGGMAEPLQPAL